jgi:hypothetical protein
VETLAQAAAAEAKAKEAEVVAADWTFGPCAARDLAGAILGQKQEHAARQQVLAGYHGEVLATQMNVGDTAAKIREQEGEMELSAGEGRGAQLRREEVLRSLQGAAVEASAAYIAARGRAMANCQAAEAAAGALARQAGEVAEAAVEEHEAVLRGMAGGSAKAAYQRSLLMVRTDPVGLVDEATYTAGAVRRLAQQIEGMPDSYTRQAMEAALAKWQVEETRLQCLLPTARAVAVAHEHAMQSSPRAATRAAARQAEGAMAELQAEMASLGEGERGQATALYNQVMLITDPGDFQQMRRKMRQQLRELKHEIFGVVQDEEQHQAWEKIFTACWLERLLIVATQVAAAVEMGETAAATHIREAEPSARGMGWVERGLGEPEEDVKTLLGLDATATPEEVRG